MAKYLIQDTTLAGIGDEIRILYGTEDTMTPAVMTNQLSNANTEVDAQTDLIQQILELLGIKDIITFTFIDTECQAEEGMTWGEWVESAYNVDGYIVYPLHWIDFDVVGPNENWAISSDSQTFDYVSLTDEIIAGYDYCFNITGG